MTWTVPENEKLSGIEAPIPCCKLVTNNFVAHQEPTSHILGPKKTEFILKFQGEGQVVGIDFKPGGLYPVIGKTEYEKIAFQTNAGNILKCIPKLPRGTWTQKN